MTKRTFVMCKPDAVERGLVGEVISRIERKGLTLAAVELRGADRALAEAHYDEHRERPFFGELVAFVTSGPIAAMVLEGERAVTVVRTMMGPTDPAEAQPGTIRGDLALSIGENTVHGSDSLESAQREIALYFADDELVG